MTGFCDIFGFDTRFANLAMVFNEFTLFGQEVTPTNRSPSSRSLAVSPQRKQSEDQRLSQVFAGISKLQSLRDSMVLTLDSCFDQL
jgi:hypothetical protein